MSFQELDGKRMDLDYKKLSGKVAVITGASSGIGLATARLLARYSVQVALVSRSQKKLEEISREIPGSLALPADMTRVPQITRMIERAKTHYGRIDILINNAGRGYDASVDQIDLEILRYIFDLHVVGPVAAMQRVIPMMRADGGGTIINISSGTALMNLPGMSPYASSKKALAGISLAARQELQNDGIVVSVVYPYITETDFEKNTIRAIPVKEEDIEPTGPHPADSAEFVAARIVDGILSGEAEIFSHEWMKKMGR
jgi:short-subunit dehydrogenase